MVVRITEKQSDRINQVVRKSCCNCIDNCCLLLDDGEPHVCVQLICRYGIYCKYLLHNVLPKHKDLYEKIVKQNQNQNRKKES